MDGRRKGRITTDSGPFSIIPQWLLEKDISDRAIRLYAILGRYADSDGRSFPRRRKLAEQLRCSLPAIDRAKHELTEIGALTIEERFDPEDGQTSNLYTIYRLQKSSQVINPLITPDNPPLITGDDPKNKNQNENHREREPEIANNTKSASSITRPRNEVWDALTTIFGEPTTDTAKTRRGKVCASLTRARASPDEIISRARRWPAHFGDATLTDTALEKHWDALGRKPLRAEGRR